MQLFWKNGHEETDDTKQAHVTVDKEINILVKPMKFLQKCDWNGMVVSKS